MTSTPVTTTQSTATRRPQWWGAATWLSGIQIYVIAWFFPMLVIIASAILAVVSRYTDIRISAAGIALHAGIWIPFSISIIVVASYLTTMVASGMTRRSFSIGALLTAIGTGLSYAIGFGVLLLLERWAYERLGWQQSSANHDGLVFDAGVLSVITGMALLFIAGNLSGLLLGIFYYRFGGWIGTLALPLALAPVALISLLTLDPGQQFTPWSAPFLSPASRPWLALVLLLLSAALFHLVIRRVPIAPKE